MSKCGVDPRGQPNWANLKEWIRAAYKGRCKGSSQHPDSRGRSQIMHMAAMCFGVIRRCKEQGMQWEKVETVLEEVHVGMIGVDAAWK